MLRYMLCSVLGPEQFTVSSCLIPFLISSDFKMLAASCLSPKKIFIAQTADCQLVLYRINIRIRNKEGQT